MNQLDTKILMHAIIRASSRRSLQQAYLSRLDQDVRTYVVHSGKGEISRRLPGSAEHDMPTYLVATIYMKN